MQCHTVEHCTIEIKSRAEADAMSVKNKIKILSLFQISDKRKYHSKCQLSINTEHNKHPIYLAINSLPSCEIEPARTCTMTQQQTPRATEPRQNRTEGSLVHERS